MGKTGFHSPFITGRLIVLCTKTSIGWSLLRSAELETVAKLKWEKVSFINHVDMTGGGGFAKYPYYYISFID